MSEVKKQAEVDFFTKVETVYEKNKKLITIGGSVLAVVGIAVVAFYGLYLPSQEREAQEQVIGAQKYFEQDSFRLALDGDGNLEGFISIIDGYGFTKTANLSKYRAGICYLHLGEYDMAIEYLEEFKGKEPITTAAAYSALGDAYAEKNDVDNALSNYKKAAKEVNDEYFAPKYLLKAGTYLKVQGKKEEALEYFMKIKNEHPNSAEAQEIDKYIAQVS